ncbi:flavodoxin domain-containing protein [Clostridium thermarum]|uniref:flavodoxin domain-containing protein n=1 Tax=Clostridium thermarum TaxID=1716543 RepID=UPI00111F8BBA|nr:flavodoxin domain-containing protein [Clostridium thermarum]
MGTLIIYATKYGCTERCAKSLSAKLSGKVDLLNIKNGQTPDITKYDKIIIGGSIYAGRIQKSIKDFCINNHSILRNKKLGLFICCGFAENFQQYLTNSFSKELLEAAVSKQCFGGELNLENMKFFDRLVTKMITKAVNKSDTNHKSLTPMILADNISQLAKAIEL